MTRLALSLIRVLEWLNWLGLVLLALVTRWRWRGIEQHDPWLDLDRFGKWRGDAS